MLQLFALSQDINGKRIHVYEASSGGHRTIQLEQPIGCIVPTSNPDVLLAALEVRLAKPNSTSSSW